MALLEKLNAGFRSKLRARDLAGVVALLVVLGTIGYKAIFTPGSRQARNTGLSIDEHCLNIGTVWEQPDFHWTIPVTNRRGENVEVVGITTSCTCAPWQEKPFVLAPNETKVLSFTLDLTNRNKSKAKQLETPFQVRLNPLIKGSPARLDEWLLSGLVRKLYQYESSVLDFDDKYILGQPAPIGVFCFTAQTRLHDVTLTCVPDLARASVKSNSQKTSFEIQVEPNPNLPTGFFDFDVHVQSVDECGQLLPTFKIPVKGSVSQNVRLSPDQLLLGVQPLGALTEQFVTLRPLVDRPFTVDSTQTSSKSLEIAQVPSAAKDESLVWRVRQRIDSNGATQNSALFTITSGGRSFTLTLIVLYHGVDL